MENKDIKQLYELKQQLLEKALQARDRLKNREETECQPSNNFNIILPSDDDDDNDKPLKSMSTKSEIKMCEMLRKITGILFKEVDKKWLHDNVYLYTAKVETKVISFNLELTVLLKDSDNFQIKDIMYSFIDIEDCYMLEITPWFQKLTATKNFSFLMSALSDYNDYYVIRSKILYSSKKERYVNIEKNTKENGGILVHLFPPADTRKIYMTFHWTIQFMELTWHIEHYFKVKPTDAGIGFSQENRILLKKFCKVGLTKSELVKLWDKLCTAIDTYHAKNSKDVNDD